MKNVYNRTQLIRDARMITQVFGVRRQRGFFTEGFFKVGPVIILDQYTELPIITEFGKEVALDALPTNSVLGQFIMTKAMAAEEIWGL